MVAALAVALPLRSTAHSFTISIDRQFAERSNDSMVALMAIRTCAGRRNFHGPLCADPPLASQSGHPL